jgi:hypothetical protein
MEKILSSGTLVLTSLQGVAGQKITNHIIIFVETSHLVKKFRAS